MRLCTRCTWYGCSCSSHSILQTIACPVLFVLDSSAILPIIVELAVLEPTPMETRFRNESVHLVGIRVFFPNWQPSIRGTFREQVSRQDNVVIGEIVNQIHIRHLCVRVRCQLSLGIETIAKLYQKCQTRTNIIHVESKRFVNHAFSQRIGLDTPKLTMCGFLFFFLCVRLLKIFEIKISKVLAQHSNNVVITMPP